MLGPTQEPPLTLVLTKEIKTGVGTERVKESYVRVEIEGDGGVVTVTRTVADTSAGRQRVRVEYGPALTPPSPEYEVGDFFVRTKGDTSS